MTNINNKPASANDHKYIVARYVDDELWYWGAYDDDARATQVAVEIDGIVIYNSEA